MNKEQNKNNASNKRDEMTYDKLKLFWDKFISDDYIETHGFDSLSIDKKYDWAYYLGYCRATDNI